MSLKWLLLSSLLYAANGAKPVGIHLDIEPHSLPGWDYNGGAQTELIANQWLDLLKLVKAETGDDIPLTVDFAMQYSSVVQITRNGETKSVADHALDIVDNVVLMAYRDYGVVSDCSETNHAISCDKENSIVFKTQALLNVTSGRGKSVKFGVETNPDVCDGINNCKLTFGDEGEAYMERVLEDTVEHFLPNPDFTGIFVHDFVNSISDSFTDSSLRPSASERSCRSYWMWDDKYVLSKDGKTPEDLVPILHAHSIDNLAVASRWYFEIYKDQFKEFVNVMGENGITVELLLANTGHTWALAVNHAEAMAIVEDAVSFINEMNGSVTSVGQCTPISRVLFTETFETSARIFDGGKITKSNPYKGKKSVMLSKKKRNTTTAQSVDVQNFKTLSIKTWYRFNKMKKNKGFKVMYSTDGGNTWILAKFLKRNKNKIKKWYNLSVTIDTAAFETLDIQFKWFGKSNKEKFTLDNIQISGTN